MPQTPLTKHPPKFNVGHTVVCQAGRRRGEVATVVEVLSGWPYADYRVVAVRDGTILTMSERDLGMHIDKKKGA